MERLTNSQLRSSYDRLTEVDSKINALQAQREEFRARNDEQLRPLYDEKKHLLDEVADGTPDFEVRKGYAGADEQGRPLFVVKKTERRTPDDKLYSFVVSAHPRLLALANSLKLTVKGEQAEFLLNSINEDDPVNGWIVTQLNGLIKKGKLKVGQRGLEKALETGSFPLVGDHHHGLTDEQTDALAHCFDVDVTKMVEPITYEESATNEHSAAETVEAQV